MNIPAIPSPPTDNLYKFMAISGVILLIVAPFFWAHYYVTQSERSRLAFEALFKSIPPFDLGLKAKNESDAATEERKKQVERYDALKKESDRIGSEFLLYERFRHVVTNAAIFLGLLGLALTGFGFPLWYIRVQKPLDRILAKQATKPHEDSA